MPRQRPVPTRYRRPGPWMTALRRLHAKGWTDPDIATALQDLSDSAIAWLERQGNWNRVPLAEALIPWSGDVTWTASAVRYYRRSWELPRSPLWPARSDGFSPGTLAAQRSRAYQHYHGWGHLLPAYSEELKAWLPGCELTPLMTDILTLLRDHGPLTRAEIVRGVGHQSNRCPLRSHGRWALPFLLAAALVCTVGAGSRPPGRRPDLKRPLLYALGPVALHGYASSP